MLGQRYVFGRGTEGAAVALAVKEPDPLAHAEPRDAVTELIDNSGAIAVGYHTRKFQCAIAAGAAADIGGIDPEASSRTRTSPGPAIGVGASPKVSTSGAAPVRSYQTAFIHSVPGNAPPSSRMFCPVM